MRNEISVLKEYVREIISDNNGYFLRESSGQKPAGFALFCRRKMGLGALMGDPTGLIDMGLESTIGEGHAFVVIVDANTGKGTRYDFGIFKGAEKCKDDRWVQKAGQSLFGKSFKKYFAFHTMGITMQYNCATRAKISKDGFQITNLKDFVNGCLQAFDKGPGSAAVIPISNPSAALQYANSMVGKCHPYSLPSLPFLETGLSCGTFAVAVIDKGDPTGIFSIETLTAIDTPDSLYSTASRLGYKTIEFSK